MLASAHRIPEVTAVATIGAPSDPEHVVHTFGGRREEIERYGEAEVNLQGRVFRIRREFLDDIAAQPQAERIHRLHHALLVLHSPTDETVGVENAQQILNAARHPNPSSRSTVPTICSPDVLMPAMSRACSLRGPTVTPAVRPEPAPRERRPARP